MFTSIDFLLVLSGVIILNYILPQKFRWCLLIVASIYFYIDWQPIYAILLFITTSITYITTILLNNNKINDKSRKYICICGSLLPLSALIFFKYYNFIKINFQEGLKWLGIYIPLPEMKILLPIGISFYTFAAIGYIIDIYRKKYAPERNFGILFLYISFFAQILSGPIPRGDSLIPQLRKPENLRYDNIIGGLRTMLWGFFMKLCVADNLGIYVDKVYSSLDAYNGGSILLAAILYTFQIYCDFAGYSLIAIGCGKMLGLRLMDNFRRPYLARNIKDFWSRWHISLSTWFRDYVYIPLGGNRRSGLRNKYNLFVTFLVSGLWHGAAWNFILWGSVHGGGQIMEKSVRKINLPPFLMIFFTFAFVSCCWVFFRLETLGEIKTAFSKIIFEFGFPVIDAVALYGITTLLFVIIKDLIDEYYPKMRVLNSSNFIISNIATGVLLCFIVLFGKFGNSNFIYFNF